MLKRKLTDIWEDYRLLVLAAALAAAVLAIFWSDFFSPDNKESAFCVVVVGQGYDYDREQRLAQETSAALELDEKEQQVIVDLSLEPQLDAVGVPPESAYLDQMKMTTYLTGGEADVVISDETVLTHYHELGGLADLREILPEEALRAWDGRLYLAKDKEGREAVCGLRLAGGSFSDGGEVYLSVSKKAPHRERVTDFVAFVKDTEGE